MQYLTLCIFMMISFLGTSVALAAGDDLADLAGPVFDAVLGGQYLYGAALALVLLVALARQYGSKVWPFLGSAPAGALMVLLGAFGAALANSLAAGAAISTTMAWGALKVAVAASGGYSILKPLVLWLSGKSPGWASPLFKLVLWIFERPDRIKEAEEAGDKAVTENPASGTGVGFTDAP